MKSIKQSRLDRLNRRKHQYERLIAAEKKLTQKERILRNNKLLKKIAKQCMAEGLKKCPHGMAFSGYECMICSSDKIAARLRSDWLYQTYYAEVVPVDSDGMYVPVTIKTGNLTKTLKGMQKNGFWYSIDQKYIFLMPESIRAVIVTGTAQSPSHSGPEETNEPTKPQRTRHAER